MRKMYIRLLALMLTVIMLISTVNIYVDASQPGTVEIINLKTEDVENPVGVDNETPTFSWNMQSSIIGQRQSAYQIKVAKDEQFNQLVWDSGKREDDHSVGIRYEGQQLLSSTVYYWTVTVWDRDDTAATSQKAAFETGLLGEDGWDQSKWIQVGRSLDVNGEIESTNYTLEYDFQITDFSVSLLLEATDGNNFLMWQFNDARGSGKSMEFKPHYRRNGNWNAIRQMDVSNYVEGSNADIQHVKLVVTEESIETWLNGHLIETIPAADLGGVGLNGNIGSLGFRSHSIDNEAGYLDNIVLTDYSTEPNGIVRKNYTFDNNVNPFSGGVIENGRLNTRFMDFETIALEKTKTTNYTLEYDFQITNFSVSLLLEATDGNNFLMWQFNDTRGSGKSMEFKPHYKKNGNWHAIRQMDVSGYVEGSNADIQHVKLVVTDEAIETWLNGQLIETIPSADLGGIGRDGSIGKLGFRSHSADQESGWLDNIVLTDYSVNSNGIILKNYTFDDDRNPFDDGVVEGGRLNTGFTREESIALEMDEINPGLHYVVEADVSCQQDAVSILFNAADERNFYMFQLSTTDSSGDIIFKPHTHTDGTWALYPEHNKTVNSIIGSQEEFKAGFVQIKIDVTETEIKTYIEDQLIDTFLFSETRGIEPQIGSLGFRAVDSEEAIIDNLKLTDYSASLSGEIVYDYTFENGNNPFIRGEIENGAFIARGFGILFPLKGIPTFRKEVLPGSALVSAKLYTTGLGVYEVYIDGQRVGTKKDDTVIYDELKPGYSHHSKRVISHAYDVTHLLQSQKASVISANVTSGWWSGEVVGSYGVENGFRAQLLLSYQDGSREVIGTDRTWKTSLEGPILYGDIFGGEIYDSNADVSYRYPGYNDAGWYYADINREFRGEISAQLGTSIRIREDLELPVKSVTVYNGETNVTDSQYGKINLTGTYKKGERFTLNPGEKAVFDLGQNFAGWDEIQVEGSKGTLLTMRHGEMLNDNNGLKSRGNDGPEGSVYIQNLRTAEATGYYRLNGNGIETYHSTSTYYGFQYVEVSATYPVTIHNMKGIVLSSVEKNTGNLSTSNSDVNQLISNIFWGQYSNYMSVPTDCPQRDERKGWAADTQVFSTAASYNAESKAFLRKYMYDMNDSQLPDGAFPDTAPYNGYGEIGQLGWTDAGVIIPYNLYKMYGDKRVIEENYPYMQKFMDEFMASTNKMGGGHNHGDWLSYEENDDDLMDLIGMAYYAWDAQMMAEMAQVLGKTEDVQKYKDIYEDEKELFQKLFVNKDGSLRQSKQTACLMALKMDLLPNEESKSIVKQMLLDNIKRNGNKLQTGFLGTAILMQTLTDIGANDAAYQLLLQRENPSWLYSVDQGATTIWERWNSYTVTDGFGPVDMNSFNHYAYGAVAEWMYSNMAGIMYDVTDPGFKHIILQPSPDESIQFVNGSYDSAYGTIVSNWEYKDGDFLYHTSIPANTTATIYLPVDGDRSIFVNNKSADLLSIESDGLRYVETVEGKAVFEAVAGTYDFISTSSDTIVLAEIQIQKPSKTEYNIGDQLDLTGMIITAVYSDGTNKTLKNTEYSVTGFSSAAAGDVTVAVSYTEGGITKTATFRVIIKESGKQDTTAERKALLAVCDSVKNLKGSDYTAASWAAFQKALADAKAILNNPNATKEQINNAALALQKAKQNLKVTIKKNTVYVHKNIKYKVTSVTKGRETVTVVGAAKKTVKKITIPPAVNLKGVNCKVTAIGAKAFKNYKKLTNVTIGANIKSIGKQAFYKNVKLRKIVVKSKVLKTVGNQALKGIYSKAVIRVPDSMKNKYKKIFKNKGQKSSVRIK